MPKSAQNRKNETLAQFAWRLDEHARRVVGFDRLVASLFTAKAQLAPLKKARAGVFAHVKRAHEIGHQEIRGTDGEVYELRLTQPGPPVVYRAAASGDVKKANPVAWQRAVVPASFVQVGAPMSVAKAVPVIEAPDGSEFMSPSLAVTVHKTHPAWYDLKRLSTQVTNATVALINIADELGWDGGAQDGPLVFRDGWSVRLTRSEYRSDALAEAAPDVFEQLAVTKVKRVNQRVYIKKITSGDEGDELDEMDEFDGD